MKYLVLFVLILKQKYTFQTCISRYLYSYFVIINPQFVDLIKVNRIYVLSFAQLPCVYLRGVYLGTLFMQGVETASMANDACGVPLPWTMCNPWLFFDGKLFHLKLKAASCVQSLRELCDDHMELVLKIERFRKAILEDVEHFLLPSIIGECYEYWQVQPGF